jgi:hypothetical protein
MPLARYFLFAGALILALLFVVDEFLPKSAAAPKADVHRPIIRIHSDRKGPEPVIYDTSTITPAGIENIEAGMPVPLTVVDFSSIEAKRREAYAELPPINVREPNLRDLTQRKPEHVRAQRKRKKPYTVARKCFALPARLMPGQPHFGWFQPRYGLHDRRCGVSNST